MEYVYANAMDCLMFVQAHNIILHLFMSFHYWTATSSYGGGGEAQRYIVWYLYFVTKNDQCISTDSLTRLTQKNAP